MDSLRTDPYTVLRKTLRVYSTVWREGPGEFCREAAGGELAEDLGTRVAVIQALILLGLAAVEDMLQQEVEALAGVRYAREGGRPGHVRWNRERGAVYLGDPKLPIVYRRVWGQRHDVEVPLETYQLSTPRALGEGFCGGCCWA